jgi:hypothetical protein
MKLALTILAATALVAGLFGATAAVASRKPSATEKAAIAQAMKTPRRCLKIRVATVRKGWASATLKVPLKHSCLPYAADGIAVLHRRDDVWRMRFAGSSWSCPIQGVPEAVRKDLHMGCPEGGAGGP